MATLGRPMHSGTHGNAASFQITGDLSPIARDKPSTMSWTVPSELPPRHIPLRPSLNSQHSNSLPSTPYQHPRDLPFTSRSPSPRRGSSSPRSTHSESHHLLPSLRRQYPGCKYETGMAHFRRRIPYSLGSELLPDESGPLKEQLDPKVEEALTKEMTELYQKLLPSPESEERRSRFVQKLENMLNKQWPGNDIEVHIFGSSGNKLYSSDSDVDICITTPFKELERVCILADFLAKNGMERVVCVSHAKVPIVKIWDPELQLACDMNVNNTLALENTRMMKTYVEIDERVRPLAMIIKYWAKRRILNDAALGGTLSSYTWLCMVVTFLQTRFPPILPSLQQGCEEKNKVKLQDDSPSTYFEDDLDKLVGLGRENKSTLGDLLFHFFRYYGHEVNFEANVVSVREGKLISKEGKGWHLLQNNRLCVEEPFNTSRNLGNTADDTSFRGLHMELRRAFTAVSEGKFEECCVQYEYPPEEERSWERPPPQPRPILSAIPSVPSRGGRGGGRGGRHANNYNRGPNTGGRRPSSAANRANNVRHTNPSFSAEIALQAQHLLHDHLYQQIQLLQAQEAELRMQLQNQSLLTGRPPPTMIRQPYLQFPVPPQDTSAADENSRARAGTVNHPPLTTPIRQQVFYHPSFLPVAMPGIQGPNTNPPSPSLAPAMPDVRRSHRRSSITNTSPRGPLRAQSQPAPAQFNLGALYSSVANPEGASALQGSPKRGTGEKDGLMPNGVPILPKGAFLTENRPSEYVGYYVGDPAHSQAARTTSIISPLAVSGGLAIQSGGFPSLARSSPEHGSSSRTAHSDRISSSLQDPHPLSTSLQSSQSRPLTRSRTQQDQGPLIVDGSVPVTERRNSIHADHGDHFMAMSPSISTSEDRPYNTPGSTSDMSQDVPDHVFYDDEYDIYERSRQGVQNHTHINGWKPTINGVAINGNIGRLELQRLQFADAVPAVDFYRRKPSTNQLRDNNNSYFFSVNDNSLEKDRHVQDKIPEPAVNTVPPAKEARTTSQPKARANGVDTERVGNASGNNKGKSKGRQDHSHAANAVQAADKKDKRGDHSHRKPNGNASSNGAHGQTHVSSSTSSWQTSKKKHRKGAKDTADTNRVHLPNGAEPLPADESLRKGG